MEKVMHETARRLFEAAKRVRKDIHGPADLARALNQSEQAVNNWSYRGNGVSKVGRLLAQKMLGISATWIEDGTGPTFVASKHSITDSDAAISNVNVPVIKSSETPVAPIVDVSDLTSPQRVRAALGGTNVSPTMLAGIVGVGADVASQWLSGTGPELNLAQAAAIQKTYGVNSVWLIKGKGEPGVAVRYNDEYRPIPITNWKPIPVVGMAQLGDNGHFSDLEYPVGHGDGYVDFPSRDPNAYALKCVGDSMRPRIRDGEFVIVEPNHDPEPGDDVLVKSKDGRVMVKTFLYKRAGRVHLVSINEAHPSMAFAEDEIEKMHYVVAYTRASMWRPG